MRRRVARISLLTIFVSALAVPRPAVASSCTPGTPLCISGAVAGQNGEAIANASVSDGSQSTLTNASGHYSLLELQFNTYSVTVSKQGLTALPSQAAITLTALHSSATQNFTTKFDAPLLSLDRTAVSTANASGSLSLTLRTFADAPGNSCAVVTDSRTGSTANMTFQSIDSSGHYVWMLTISLPLQTTEGQYTLTGKVVDCASPATELDANATAIRYLVDNTAPRLSAVAPVDGGNVFASSFRAAADVTDSGSGLNSASPAATLTDQTALPVLISHPNVVYYGPGMAMGTPDPISVVPGHSYRLEMTATDLAGNVAGTSVAFTANSIVVPDASIKVPSAPGAGGTSCANGLCLWSFVNAEVEAAPVSVSISGSSHAGYGAIGERFSLNDAVVSYTLGDQSVSATLANVVADQSVLRTREIHEQIFTLASGLQPQTIGTSSVSATLTEAIPVRLPIGAVSPTLSMATSGTADLNFGAGPLECSAPGADNPDERFHCRIDPIATPVQGPNYCASLGLPSDVLACNPDAFYYFVADGDAQDVLNNEVSEATDQANNIPSAICDDTCRAVFTTDTVSPVFNANILDTLVLDPTYQGWLDPFSALSLYGGPPSTRPNPATLQDDVYSALVYPANGTPLLATQYHSVCTFIEACNLPTANADFANYTATPATAPDASSPDAPQSPQPGDDQPCPWPYDGSNCISNEGEICVDNSGHQAASGSTKCRQHVKIRSFNWGGTDPSNVSAHQAFIGEVSMSVGMHNSDWDSLGIGWTQPQSGYWHADSGNGTRAWKGGRWMRRYAVLHDDYPTFHNDTSTFCHVEYTYNWYALADNSTGNTTYNTMETYDANLSGYGRRVMQGWDYTKQCPHDADGYNVLSRRMVAASAWMGLYESQTSAGPFEGNFLTEYGHWTRKVSWSWSIGGGYPWSVSISLTPQATDYQSIDEKTTPGKFYS